MTRWRKIKGFPNYVVSEEGEVMNKARKQILKPSYTRQGHASVNLYFEGVRYCRAIDKLVLTAFYMPAPIRENVTYIPMHLDGRLDNCHISNLTWEPRVKVYKRSRERPNTLDT